MSETGKHSANSDGAIKPVARRPGPPKGTPRPAGAGRKKGVPNRITKDVREAAAKHGKKALAKLVKLMEDQDARVSLAATREILDRAYGRPVSPQEITGKDGAPIAQEISSLEVVKRIAFALRSGTAERDRELRHQKTAETQSAPPAPPPEPEISPSESPEANSRWVDPSRLLHPSQCDDPPQPKVIRFRPKGI